MKKILSTVLALCMILGCVAVGFTAQAATGADLQAAINAAIASDGVVNWTGGNLQLTKPLTINGNVKIDFNGATILGAAYKHSVIISGGNVELINADIEGTGGHYEGIINPSDHIRGFVDEIADACPTIYIGNANVTMTDMVVTGAYLRVIGTGAPHGIDEVKIPGSDAITMANANAVLNLNNVRAFGNIGVENLYGSKVNVTECIIGGYTKDFNDESNVSYAADTKQYRNMDLIKEVIDLTEGEDKYMTKFFDHFLQVTASVKNQNYVEPTFAYDALTETLTLTATADKSYGDVQKMQAFDYYYVPKTATIGEETKEFTKVDKLTYTVSFDDIADGQDVDVDFIYKLAIDLGEDADAAISSAYAMIDNALASVPDMLEDVNDAIYEFIGDYIGKFYPKANDGKTDEGYATLLWNAYQEFGVDALLGDLNTAIEQADEAINNTTEGTQERAEAEAAKQDAINAKNKAEADIKAFFGPIFDLCGVELYANLDQYATLRNAIQAVRSGNYSTGQYNDVRNRIVATLNPKFGATFDTTPEDSKDLGKGLLYEFLEYWDNVYALAVKDGDFNDIRGLGEYIGANYLEFYDLLKDMKALAHRLGDMINDPDNYVVQMLGDTFQINGKGISEYVGLVNEGLATVDSLFARADSFLANNGTYNNILNTFGDRVPEYCGIYAEKAFNFVSDPEDFINIETDGTFVEGFEFPQEATYTIPANVDMVKVTVNVTGYGKYAVNSREYTTTQVFNVPMGGNFTVAPVEMGEEIHFDYFALSDTDGNARLSPNGGALTVYSDTIITLYFSAATSEGDDPTYDVVFMTNYELSSLWLNTLVAGEIDEIPAAPAFDGATFLGWSRQNVSGAAAEQSGLLMSNSDVYDAANSATANTTFYAIYKFEQMTVDSALLQNTLTMTDVVVNNDTHRAYFTVLISNRALANGDAIVEAGVLGAANAATIETATPNGGSGIIKGNLDLDTYSLPAFYTYAIYFNNHSTDRTAFAKGFVTIRHADGTYTTEYTAVQSGVIAAY